MKLQQFDGGVATRLAPQLLNNNQGVVYENIDNSTGVLTPIKDKLATDIAVEKYNKYFVTEDEWLSSAVPTDYLEFQRKMYLTDRISRPQKYSNGIYNFLGIEAPASASVLTKLYAALPLTDITVLNDITTGDLPASDFDYMLFNVNNGIYSTPFKFTVDGSSTVTTRASGKVISYDDIAQGKLGRIATLALPTNRAIKISDILGPYADSAVLYRYYDGVWRLVNTFATKAEVFLDDVFDIGGNPELDENLISPFFGTYQYVYTYYNSDDGTESAPTPVSNELEVNSGHLQITLPTTSTDHQVTNKRLYRVGGNITQFTMVVELDSGTTSYIDTLKDTELDGRLLESDNYDEAPAGLQFLSESYAMLFGAIGSSLRFTPIGVPNAWPPEFQVQFDQDITGLGPVANGILVFTRFKTYIVTGTGPTSLSQQSLRGDQGCIAFESIQEATKGTLIWASEDGLCTSSGNNVVNLTKSFIGKTLLDPISSVVNDEVYYCHNVDGSVLSWDYRFQPTLKWLSLGTETLSVSNGILYGYSNGLLHLLYKDTNNLTFRYKSPLFVEGSFSENKTYKKVFIRSEGDIIINIIIDNKVVATSSLTGIDTFQLQVPQQEQRGYSIQFEIEGTGIINEIEYVASPRKNG